MKKAKPQPVPIKIGGVPFSKLSKAAQRVAIAKDVIAQIRAEKYIIKTGTWADIDVITPDSAYDSECPVIDQHALLHGLTPVERKLECKCCAIGAAFLSSIRLANKAVVRNGYVDGMDEAKVQLDKYFSDDQLELIEEVFEGGQGACHTEDDKGIVFGEKYNNHEKRALAIFSNIVP